MWKSCLMSLALVLCLSCPVLAHFGMVIPTHAVIEDKKTSKQEIQFSFSHPMAMEGMPLAKPRSVQIFAGGKTEDLTAALRPVKIMDHQGWELHYTVKRPGVYQIVMEPQPYWEPAEDCFIIHYTKSYLSAFGDEDGWAEPLGLKTEILPLTRPFGNYAGNIFQGQVMLDGKPVPGAEVEVEHYNEDHIWQAPNEAMSTQVVRADANGIFSYVVPFAGWWGFAALNTAEEKMEYKGTPKAVELGAVLWMEFVAPQKK